jgi:hypothetical protein
VCGGCGYWVVGSAESGCGAHSGEAVTLGELAGGGAGVGVI